MELGLAKLEGGGAEGIPSTSKNGMSLNSTRTKAELARLANPKQGWTTQSS